MIWITLLASTTGLIGTNDCDREAAQAGVQEALNACSFFDLGEAEENLENAFGDAAAQAVSNDRRRGKIDIAITDLSLLTAAQEQWTRFREAHCAAMAGPQQGSSAEWPQIKNGCMISITDARTAQLQTYTREVR